MTNRPNTIDPDLYALARTILTDGELDVWKLAAHGYSQRRITRQLHISRTTVRDRLERAHDKLEQARKAAA